MMVTMSTKKRGQREYDKFKLELVLDVIHGGLVRLEAVLSNDSGNCTNKRH
jgi:hypothetical protein